MAPDPWQFTVLDGWLGVYGGKWSAPRCGLTVPRQNGKNGVLEIVELFKVVALGRRILHTAHEVKTARKAFIRLVSFFENEREWPELAALVKEVRRTNGQEALVLTNGGSVEFVARSKGSGRGFTVDDLVCDEAQDLSEDQLAALLPTISAAPSGDPQVMLTGTPPAPSMQGDVWARMRAAGIKGEDKRLAWFEWSCGEDVEVDDRTAWAAANPALGIRLNWETVGDERAQMDEATFARERLGVWFRAGGSRVLGAEWDDSADEFSEPAGTPVVGIEVNQDLVTSLAYAATREDGRTHVEVFDSRGGLGWVPDRLIDFLDRSHAHDTVYLNSTGNAGALLTALRARGIDVEEVSTREFAQGCGAFLDAVLEGRVRYRNRYGLQEAGAVARKRSLGDAWAWNRKDAKSDISPMVAANVAWLGHATVEASEPAGGWMVSL